MGRAAKQRQFAVTACERKANRLNVAITGVESASARYTPKWTEVVITVMFVALGFAIFGAVTKYLPVFPKEQAPIPAPREPAFAELAAPVQCWRLTSRTGPQTRPRMLLCSIRAGSNGWDAVSVRS